MSQQYSIRFLFYFIKNIEMLNNEEIRILFSLSTNHQVATDATKTKLHASKYFHCHIKINWTVFISSDILGMH